MEESRPAGEKARRDEPEIKQRIEVFLGEFRILIPAVGALLGFQLISAFSTGWNELEARDKAVNLVAVSATAVALGFLLLPSTYHRATARLEESENFLRFAQKSFGVGFIFVAISLSLSLFLQARRVFPHDTLVPFLVLFLFSVFFLVLWGILPQARAKHRERRIGRRLREDEAAPRSEGGPAP
jgi:hypothetical protein